MWPGTRGTRKRRSDCALNLPLDRPLVLSSFGGYGVSGLNIAQLDCLDRYGVVLTCRDATETRGDAVAGLYELTEDHLYGSGLRYEDLVGACDVVATKPGYGIIAECIANDTAILYTSRGQFAEYDVLVSALPRYTKCGFIAHEDLFAGRWRAALDSVTSSPQPSERPPTNGAEVIAGMIDHKINPTC